jgi:hypothetical protein
MINAQRGRHSLLFASDGITVAQAANLDTIGADYATIDVALSAEITTDAVVPVLSLLDNDTTVVTDFATIVADVSGDDVTAARVHTYHVDLRGRKRYLRLTVTPGTVATDDAIAMTAVASLTRLVEEPGATGDMSTLTTIV